MSKFVDPDDGLEFDPFDLTADDWWEWLTEIRRERDEARAEVERLRRLVGALRSLAARWNQQGTDTGTGCCERELRAALAGSDGEAGEP